MTNQVTIANRALTKIGARRIVALTDESLEATTLTAMYDTVRDDELRANRWSFSIARIQLAADATDPDFGYAHRYLLPTGFLRLLMAGSWAAPWTGAGTGDYLSGPDSAAWAIEGRYLLVDQEGPLNVRYIQQITDTSLFDSCFVEAFACRLAAELAEPITQSSEKRQLAWQEYERAIMKAVRANAIELPPRQIDDDTWVTARVRS